MSRIFPAPGKPKAGGMDTKEDSEERVDDTVPPNLNGGSCPAKPG